jgi:hypothetical protein
MRPDDRTDARLWSRYLDTLRAGVRNRPRRGKANAADRLRQGVELRLLHVGNLQRPFKLKGPLAAMSWTSPAR